MQVNGWHVCVYMCVYVCVCVCDGAGVGWLAGGLPGEDDVKEELDKGEERKDDPVRQPLLHAGS